MTFFELDFQKKNVYDKSECMKIILSRNPVMVDIAFKLIELITNQFLTGQDGLGLVNTVQDWSELVRTGQDRSGLVKTGQNWSRLVITR